MEKLQFTAHQYALDVVSGKILSCKWVKLSCQRYISDLENADKKGFYFDEKAAKRVISFYSKTNLVEGEWAGSPFLLEPWQQFIIWNIFGWKLKSNHLRRFRKAYVSVARKNGKSPLAAVLGIYMMAFDKEPRAQVYSAAVDKDQAKVVWGHAKDVINRCGLMDHVKTYQGAITHEESLSFFKPLSKDTKNKDGFNPACAIIDEYHAHPNNEIVDVLETAFGARRQPLEFIITTRGFNRTSPCYEFEQVVSQILEGQIENESTFGIIYTIDEGEDWSDERVWTKANPNLGVSVKKSYLSQQILDAQQQPSKQPNVQTKNMNMWTDTFTTWISDDVWMNTAKIKIPDLRNRTCWAGLDLSTVRDISAYVKIFPDGDLFYIVPTFFLPSDQIDPRVKKNLVNYDVWVRKGLIIETPGNVIDYNYIQNYIYNDSKQYDLKSIAYDRYNSSQTIIELNNLGLTTSQFGQGYVSMSTPTKEIEKLALTEKLIHEGNPVLRWMASNVSISKDAAGNIKIDKAKSTEKVDGMVALVMAYGQYLTDLAENKADPNRVYSERGIRFLGED